MRAQPATRVQVIVQEFGHNSSGNWLVTRLGGRAASYLSIINVVVATPPPDAAQALTASPAVRWVSPDAPVVKSNSHYTCCTALVLQDVYQQAIGASTLWSRYQDIGVPFVESGMSKSAADWGSVSWVSEYRGP